MVCHVIERRVEAVNVSLEVFTNSYELLHPLERASSAYSQQGHIFRPVYGYRAVKTRALASFENGHGRLLQSPLVEVDDACRYLGQAHLPVCQEDPLAVRTYILMRLRIYPAPVNLDARTITTPDAAGDGGGKAMELLIGDMSGGAAFPEVEALGDPIHRKPCQGDRYLTAQDAHHFYMEDRIVFEAGGHTQSVERDMMRIGRAPVFHCP